MAATIPPGHCEVIMLQPWQRRARGDVLIVGKGVADALVRSKRAEYKAVPPAPVSVPPATQELEEAAPKQTSRRKRRRRQ